MEKNEILEEINTLKKELKKQKTENKELKDQNQKLIKKYLGDGLDIVNISVEDQNINFELISDTYITSSILAFQKAMEKKFVGTFIHLGKLQDDLQKVAEIRSFKVYTSKKRFAIQLRCNILEKIMFENEVCHKIFKV